MSRLDTKYQFNHHVVHTHTERILDTCSPLLHRGYLFLYAFSLVLNSCCFNYDAKVQKILNYANFFATFFRVKLWIFDILLNLPCRPPKPDNQMGSYSTYNLFTLDICILKFHFYWYIELLYIIIYNNLIIYILYYLFSMILTFQKPKCPKWISYNSNNLLLGRSTWRF